MDDVELSDLLLHIEETVPLDRRAEAFEAAADDLGPEDFGRPALLVAAADHWGMRGEPDRAHRVLDVAEAEGGEPADGVLPTRLDLALAAGDESLAKDVLARLRVSVRDDALIALDYERVAGVLEAHGDLRGALRWYTMPFTHAEPDDPDLDPYCLAGRARIRRALGMPPDRFDRHPSLDDLDLGP